METKRHWQEWINMLLGVWLFTAPFFGVGAINSVAAWDGYIFGALILVLSGTAFSLSQVWEEWINMMIGIWLIVAPFALGFYHHHMVAFNHINVGVGILGVALWEVTKYMPYSHDPHITIRTGFKP